MCRIWFLLFQGQTQETVKLALLPNLQSLFEAYDWQDHSRAIDALVTLVKDSESLTLS
jgi:hypothetical protein